MRGINTHIDADDTRRSITLTQRLINKINAKVEFTHGKEELIIGTPTRLHRSLNPSVKYTDIYDDVLVHVKKSDGTLVGVRHLDGTYEILKYLP